MPASYVIRLLGPFMALRDRVDLDGFESRKTRALLGYLVSIGKPVPREHLADLLWNDKSEARGRRNLSHELALLARLLPGCFAVVYDSIQFKAAPECWVDVLVYRQLTSPASPDLPSGPSRVCAAPLPRPPESTESRIAELLQAAELPCGAFLEGLALDDSPDFELWLAREQEQWRQSHAALFECLVVYFGMRGENGRAQHLVRQWLALEPWREEAHQHLMRLLALAGQRSAALAQFKLLVKLLAEELAVTPSTETVGLYESIRAGAFAKEVGS